jgi:hypothetical protein
MIQPIKSAATICHSIRVSNNSGLLLIIVFLTLLTSAITGYARIGIFERIYCMQSLAGAGSGAAIKVADVPSLEQGKPIERELAGGDYHPYRLTLVAGQFCHIVVDQRGVDLTHFTR